MVNGIPEERDWTKITEVKIYLLHKTLEMLTN